MSPRPYGSPPEVIGPLPLASQWHEVMRYLYMPVSMPKLGIELPEALWFLYNVLEDVAEREDPGIKRYIYITAKRGYATPDNPINRPGWHADGFGTDDINYIWTDRWPTVFAVQDFHDITDDHVESMKRFEEQADPARFVTYPDQTLLRLDSSVIHRAPEILAPGGNRSFFKISVSKDRYNLLGNSHNFRFKYHWHMYSREEIRNDPSYAGGDAGPQEEGI